jgi:hypothetical protein
MRTARTLEAGWWQVLRGSVDTGAKENESSTGRVWAAGFHHVTARSRLAGVLELANRLFLYFSIFFRVAVNRVNGGTPGLRFSRLCKAECILSSRLAACEVSVFKYPYVHVLTYGFC